MKISKQQWQEWASKYAMDNVEGMAKYVPMRIDQVAAFKCMLEATMMCGMSMVEDMKQHGYDTSEALDLKPSLVRSAEGDKTYKMRITETDGGGIRLVDETDLPDFPRDGRL